jgi:ribosomal-protein-alanine N-acetyltransferase
MHVSTIATHPDHRNQGLGEATFAGMLQRGIELKSEYCVLEVRVSNESAKTIYFRYGFEVVGRRRHYYRDNNEDALLMTLSPIDATYLARFTELFTGISTRVSFTNLLPAGKPKTK